MSKIDQISKVGEALSNRQQGMLQTFQDKLDAFVNKVKLLLGVGQGVSDKLLSNALKELQTIAKRQHSSLPEQSESANNNLTQKLGTFAEKISQNKNGTTHISG